MEYRIKDYTIRAQMILLPRPTTIEDLRLIFNETQKKLICSTANKDLVTLRQQDGSTVVVVPSSVCTLNETDQLTIKCDYGDNLEEVKEAVENIDLTSIESKVETESQTIQSAIQNIDLSSVEGKVDEVKQAVDNIKLPEIDTTELAKQGENQEATNSAILDAVNNLYSSFDELYAGQIKVIIGDEV